MKNILKLLFPLCFLLSLHSCGLDNTETERQEVIDRLRALGVSVEPPIPHIPAEGESPSPVILTLHLALPTDSEVKVEPWKNLSRPGANAILIENEVLVNPSVEEQRIGSLRILKVKASTAVPTLSRWRGIEGGGAVQYGFKVTTADRIEYVSGEFLAFKKGEKELEWKAPSIEIKLPAAGSVVNGGDETEIFMDITNPQDEVMSTGWFVEGGEVSSRRQARTVWKPSKGGEQVLIATARGLESLMFAIKIIKVNSP